MKNFILIIILISLNKFGFSDNLFETTYYNVEFISQNIENDKILKINQIKYESISNIFEKTLDDRNYKEIKKNLSNDFINTLIKNIIIDDEKVVDNKYFSKIKINFDKKKIINYFRDNKIPYVEYYPDKFLLIIYENNKLHNNLLTRNNNFYIYFKENLASNKLFKLPNLDINDRFILQKEDLRERNLEKINIFANKYNLNEAIIIIANINNNNAVYELIYYSHGKIYEKIIEYNKYNFEEFYYILEKEVINIWKKLNQIQNISLNIINCKVSYFNIMELKEIRKKLTDVSLIKKLEIQSLAYKSIEYKIYYYGNSNIFLNVLKMNKLNFQNKKNICSISLK